MTNLNYILKIRDSQRQKDIDAMVKTIISLNENPLIENIPFLLTCLHDQQINTLGDLIVGVLTETYESTFQYQYIEYIMNNVDIIYPHAMGYYTQILTSLFLNQDLSDSILESIIKIFRKLTNRKKEIFKTILFQEVEAIKCRILSDETSDLFNEISHEILNILQNITTGLSSA
jgi:hypothetical protein